MIIHCNVDSNKTKKQTIIQFLFKFLIDPECKEFNQIRHKGYSQKGGAKLRTLIPPLNITKTVLMKICPKILNLPTRLQDISF